MKNLFFLITFLWSFMSNAQTVDFYTTMIDNVVDEYVVDVMEYDLNHFIIIGASNSDINRTPHTYRIEDSGILIKMNSMGNITQKMNLGQKRVFGIDKVNNNRFVICGVNNINAWVAEIDSNFNFIWEWTKNNFEPNGTYEVITNVLVQDTIINIVGSTDAIWGGVYIAKLSVNNIFLKDTLIIDNSNELITSLFKDFQNNAKYWLPIRDLSTPVSYIKAIQIDENLAFTDTLFFRSDATRRSFKWFDKDFIISGGYGLDNSEISIPVPSDTYVWNDLIFSKQHKDSMEYVFPSPNFVGAQTYLGKTDTSEYYANKRTLDFVQKDLIYLGGVSNMYRQYGPYLEAPGFHQNDTWLFINCLDSMGNLQWQRYFGGDENYHLMSIKATQDGGVLLLGTTFDYTSGVNRRNVHIIKLKNDIQVGSEEVIKNETDLSVRLYPNPTSDYLQFEIETNEVYSQNFDLKVYNVNGQLLMNRQLRTGLNRYNIGQFPVGAYFYSIVNEDNKLVKSGQFLKGE